MKVEGFGTGAAFRSHGKYLFTLDSVLVNDLKTNSMFPSLRPLEGNSAIAVQVHHKENESSSPAVSDSQ